MDELLLHGLPKPLIGLWSADLCLEHLHGNIANGPSGESERVTEITDRSPGRCIDLDNRNKFSLKQLQIIFGRLRPCGNQLILPNSGGECLIQVLRTIRGGNQQGIALPGCIHAFETIQNFPKNCTIFSSAPLFPTTAENRINIFSEDQVCSSSLIDFRKELAQIFR